MTAKQLLEEICAYYNIDRNIYSFTYNSISDYYNISKDDYGTILYISYHKPPQLFLYKLKEFKETNLFQIIPTMVAQGNINLEDLNKSQKVIRGMFDTVEINVLEHSAKDIVKMIDDNVALIKKYHSFFKRPDVQESITKFCHIVKSADKIIEEITKKFTIHQIT